jgi:tetratricopeptide (TPR) repeat protein
MRSTVAFNMLRLMWPLAYSMGPLVDSSQGRSFAILTCWLYYGVPPSHSCADYMNEPPGVTPPPLARHRELTLPTWVFGSLLLAFALGVFVFGPDALPDHKQRILAIAMSLLAGLFGFFMTGDIGLELRWVASRFGEVGVKAAGGVALFVLVLVWWLSPLAPVPTQEMKERLERVVSTTTRIEGKTDKVVALLEQQLSVKDQQIEFLQAQLAGGEPPRPSERARQLAAEIPDTAGPYARGLKATAERQFDDARRLLDEVIANPETELVRAYSARGDVEFYAGRYADAAVWYQKALALRPNDPDLLNAASLALLEGAQYSAAERLLRRALVIREQTLNPDHPDVATALHNLASLYSDQGKLEAAESLYRRALAIDEKALGPDSPVLAMTLNSLAGVYEAQDKLAEAEPLLQRALAIQQKALGAENPFVAEILSKLAVLYQSQGELAKAEPLFRRALAMRQKTLDPGHPDVAKSLNNLARLYFDQGKLAEAATLFRSALAIEEKALGPDHPSIATSLNNLASVYQAQGKLAEAEPMFQRVVVIMERALGPDHPLLATGLNNLGLIYQLRGKLDEAEPPLKRARAITEKALGPDHPEVATSLNNLAKLYELQGKLAEAEPLYRRAVDVTEKALGPDHPTTAKIRRSYAALLRRLGRPDEALALEARGHRAPVKPR